MKIDKNSRSLPVGAHRKKQRVEPAMQCTTTPNLSPSQQEALFVQVMLAVKPDYFEWPPDAQELYRLKISNKDYLRINRILYDKLFNIRIRNFKKIHLIYELLDEEQQALLNNIWQFLHGMGDDYFHISHQLGDYTLHDFITVDDYSRHHHYCDEKLTKEMYPDYIIKPYRGVLDHFIEAELMINGMFHDAGLLMADEYINGEIDGQKMIGELIPHEYHYDTGYVDANGKEAELEELKRDYAEYHVYALQRLKNTIKAWNKKFPKRVYLVDRNWKTHKKQGTHWKEQDFVHQAISFVFSDNAALKAVRFRHFMSDCQNILGDNDELESLIKQEQRATLEFIERAYRDILIRRAPNIIRIPRNSRTHPG